MTSDQFLSDPTYESMSVSGGAVCEQAAVEQDVVVQGDEDGLVQVEGRADETAVVVGVPRVSGVGREVPGTDVEQEVLEVERDGHEHLSAVEMG